MSTLTEENKSNPTPPSDKPQYDAKLVEKLISKYKSLDSQFKELVNLNSKLEDENKSLTEKVKNLEKKNSENVKNLSSVGLSRVDFKKQFEMEIFQLKESLTIIQKIVDEKNEEITNLREEISELRVYLDEERKKNEALYAISKTKNKDIELCKISGENSSYRSRNIDLENQVSTLREEVEKLKIDKLESDKKLKENIEIMRVELNLKNNSYKTLIKDLQNTTQVLYNNMKDYELLKYQHEKTHNEHHDNSLKLSFIEKENLNLKSECDDIKKLLKRKEVELNDYEKNFKEFQSKINDSKKEKQVFEVIYNQYMMKHIAKFIFQKEDDVFWFTLETKFNSRKYNIIDIEISVDNKDLTKFGVKFLRSQEKEEIYFSEENKKLLQAFSDFRKNAIEVSGVGVIPLQKSPINISKARENVDNFLEF